MYEEMIEQVVNAEEKSAKKSTKVKPARTKSERLDRSADAFLASHGYDAEGRPTALNK